MSTIQNPFNAVMIIPTGIQCKIGGHAGDATLVARLLARVCDTLIVHPNVVNAADLNEIPSNALYVEGSMLDKFLHKGIGLKLVRSNRILVLTNEPHTSTLNCINAARSLLGIDIHHQVLKTQLRMVSQFHDDKATGYIEGLEQLWSQFGRSARSLGFNAIAVHSVVEVPIEVELQYLRGETMLNPWGGVEAMLSREMSEMFNMPVAHAPIETNTTFNEVVPQPLAPELISASMLFSVLKGLHKAPRPIEDLNEADLIWKDVDVMISPDCWGTPHEACVQAGIPIIMVMGNTTSDPAESVYGETIIVDTYTDAMGVMLGMQEGIELSRIRDLMHRH